MSNGNPIAWESTTIAYRKYITQDQYEKFSGPIKAWYKPYKCAQCQQTEAALTAAREEGRRQGLEEALDRIEEEKYSDQLMWEFHYENVKALIEQKP